MHMRFQDRMIKLWARIKKLSPDKPIYKVYDESLRLSQEGHDTWADCVNNIISRYTDDSSFQSNDIDKRVNHLRERRYTQFIRDWTQDLHVNNKWPKLDTYKLIKTNYRIESHILYVRDKNHQRTLTRLRVSSQKLNIEAGRHARPYVPRQQRLCLYCDSRELDDETHFLLRCNFHSEARDPFIRKIAEHLPVQLETVPHTKLFIDIMTSKNTDILNEVAKFVYLEFKRRELCPGNNYTWKYHLSQYFAILDSHGGEIRHDLSVSNICLAHIYVYILYSHYNYLAYFNSNEWRIYCLTHWGRYRVAANSGRRFRVHFLEWTCIDFNKDFAGVCSWRSNWQYSCIGSGGGLAPPRRQAGVWASDG